MPRTRIATPLRWSDMDAYGHVNNVQFLRLIEEARVLAMSEGTEPGASMPGTGLVVARTEIEYLYPLEYRPGSVAVDLWVTRIGAADFDMAYEVLDRTPDGRGTGRVYAHALTTLVTYDLGTTQPRRISDDERKLLDGWLDRPIRWRRRRVTS